MPFGLNWFYVHVKAHFDLVETAAFLNPCCLLCLLRGKRVKLCVDC